MAYAEVPNTDLKQYYRPCKIVINSPVDTSYDNFSIEVQVQKVVIDLETNVVSSIEEVGTIVRSLSQIDIQTIGAVEMAISKMMKEHFGIDAMPGPIREV